MSGEEQYALDMSLKDACKIARRMVRFPKGHKAALVLVRKLRELGARDE